MVSRFVNSLPNLLYPGKIIAIYIKLKCSIRREACDNFLNGKLQICMISGEGRSGWGVGESILYKIPQLFSVVNHVYLA